MAEYYICRNCGNEEPGTNLYVCSNEHPYCHVCAEVIIYDMPRVICSICKEYHKERYGVIADKQNADDNFDDDNIDDFIDDDVHDYVDDISYSLSNIFLFLVTQ